ncbi:MAG: cell wall-binding repeat-containing protein [Firmicutes bacterium]|nr:cell wall-binding repeat-containing protein [Bacillota bacterium]
MRKTLKSLLVILMICITVVGSPAATQTAEAASVTDKAVYWTTGYNRSYCTFTANIYMIRRAMIARGSTQWSKVTYKTAGSALCAGVPAMKWHYTFSSDGVTVKGEHITLSGSASQKAAKLRALLDKHPEGVVVRGNRLAGYAHGALLTGYYGKGNNQFWVADSTHNASKFVSSPRGIETWAKSTLNDVSNVQDVWYLKSVSGIAKSAKNTWITLNGKKYYYDAENKRVRGWKTIGDNQYYFSLNDGHLLTGYQIIDGEPVYLDEKTGALIEDENLAVQHCFGENRYATALTVADALKYELGVEKFDTIVVANGTNYPDALSGGYLASKNNAPILLVGKGYEKAIATYIQSTLSENGKVYILGDKGAVSENFEKLVIDKGATVERLAGSTRYETNLAIIEETGVEDGELLVCNGGSYADSLSASCAGKPILLVGSSLTADQKAFIEKNSDKVTILGGTKAVNSTVEKQIRDILEEPVAEPDKEDAEVVDPAEEEPVDGTDTDAEVNAEADADAVAEEDENKDVETTHKIAAEHVTTEPSVKRIAGRDRYATSALIAMEFGGTNNGVILVYGKNFPDGLSGGPLAAITDRPIVLASSSNTEHAKNVVSGMDARTAFVIGGPGLISRATAETICG